jgi:hypothetical protein
MGRSMKKRNRLLLIFLGIVLIFIVARYGWRFFGFSMCDNKMIEVLDVGEEIVSFKVISIPNSFPSSFIGYKAEQKGDKLYIGVKFNMIFGILPTDDGTGYFSVPIDGKVNQIIDKGSNELILWDREANDKFTLQMYVHNSDAEMLRYDCYLGDELITQKNIAYESPDFPLDISKSNFPEDADLRQLRIEFYAIEEGSECKVGELADFDAEWGQTYKEIITKRDGVYSLKYLKVYR